MESRLSRSDRIFEGILIYVGVVGGFALQALGPSSFYTKFTLVMAIVIGVGVPLLLFMGRVLELDRR